MTTRLGSTRGSQNASAGSSPSPMLLTPSSSTAGGSLGSNSVSGGGMAEVDEQEVPDVFKTSIVPYSEAGLSRDVLLQQVKLLHKQWRCSEAKEMFVLAVQEFSAPTSVAANAGGMAIWELRSDAAFCEMWVRDSSSNPTMASVTLAGGMFSTSSSTTQSGQQTVKQSVQQSDAAWCFFVHYDLLKSKCHQDLLQMMPNLILDSKRKVIGVCSHCPRCAATQLMILTHVGNCTMNPTVGKEALSKIEQYAHDHPNGYAMSKRQLMDNLDYARQLLL